MSAVSLSTATDTMGMRVEVDALDDGLFHVRGNSARIALILACASCCAVGDADPQLNSTTTMESPSVVVEEMCRTPGMVLSASSMRLVTSRSTVSGDAPG